MGGKNKQITYGWPICLYCCIVNWYFLSFWQLALQQFWLLFVVIINYHDPLIFSGRLKSPWSRKKKKHALSPRQWRNMLTPDGKLRDGGVKLVKKVRSGVSYICNWSIWLLHSEVLELHRLMFPSLCFMYNFVSVIGESLSVSLSLSRYLFSYFLMKGVDPSIRAEVWPFLLGV